MMISEQTLTLYYYEDGLDSEQRSKVEQALREDAVLAARYTELCRQLEQWRQSEDVITPSHLVQRLHDSIDRAARAETQRSKREPRVHFLSFFWGAAITAALAVGIGIGFWFAESAPVTTVPDYQANISPDVGVRPVPVSFTRSLQLHLQESQWEIASLPVDDESQRALLALQLIDKNRLFMRSATMNNSPEFARVLRAFEPVLMQLASDEISPQDATALREKLAFEMSVMLTKLSRDASEVAETI